MWGVALHEDVDDGVKYIESFTSSKCRSRFRWQHRNDGESDQWEGRENRIIFGLLADLDC